MIKKITEFTDINGGFPPFMSVIQTDFKFASNNFDGAYYQEIESEKTLLLSIRGVTATICRLSENVDVEELSFFLDFNGVQNVLSDFFFDGYNLEKRAVLKIEPYEEFIEKIVVLTPASKLADYENVFKLLSKNGSFDVWYPVISRKINNSCACGVYLEENSIPVSCAIAPFVYGKTGVVAGVFTDENYRNKGYATKCVKALLSELKKENVNIAYLWCEDKNIKLYENIGFSVCGEIYVKREE